MVFDDKEFIAKKIRMARKKTGLTQEILAEKVGITSKQISRIEIAAFMPSVPTFLRIVKVLEIDLSEFGLEKIENINPTREEFIKIIQSLPDNQLKFCLENIKTTINNFDILKYN